MATRSDLVALAARFRASQPLAGASRCSSARCGEHSLAQRLFADPAALVRSPAARTSSPSTLDGTLTGATAGDLARAGVRFSI